MVHQLTFEARRRMPKTAPPPTTTSAPATPAIMSVLEFAPASARLESPVTGDGELSPVVAGAAVLSEVDGVGSSAGAFKGAGVSDG